MPSRSSNSPTEDSHSAAEPDTTESPTDWTPSILNLLARRWRAFQVRRQRRRSHGALLRLSDRELKDIGLTSTEIECIAARRAIERLREHVTCPWMR